jgi:ketosteroid isomerase-like protein
LVAGLGIARDTGRAVSHENVELHRRAHDAFNRRDLSVFLSVMSPEVEFAPYEVAVQGGSPYRGHDGVRSWWEETFAVLPDLRVETYEISAFGERTFARGCLHARGAGSGASIDRTLWQAVEWRDGKTVWWHAFDSEAEALEAAKRSGSA